MRYDIPINIYSSALVNYMPNRKTVGILLDSNDLGINFHFFQFALSLIKQFSLLSNIYFSTVEDILVSPKQGIKFRNIPRLVRDR